LLFNFNLRRYTPTRRNKRFGQAVSDADGALNTAWVEAEGGVGMVGRCRLTL
jgi:hypothetical protein